MPVSQEELNYFKDMDGVIQVFEFDYEKILEFNWQVMNKNFLASLICVFPLLCAPCHCACAYDNIKDRTYTQHICLTKDGIRYIVDKHKTSCRFDCQVQGKTTKTVPYDKITDCDVEEAAGATGPVCCLTQNVLATVNVGTGRVGEDGPAHELTLQGLKDPYGFKTMVWKLKRDGTGAMFSLDLATAPKAQVMGQIMGHQRLGNTSELAQLLERTNELLEQIAANTKK